MLNICKCTIVRFLGNLSAMLPATRPRRNMGDILDIPTSATWKGESVSSRTSQERIVTSIIRFIYQKIPADHNLLYAGLCMEKNTEGCLFSSDFDMVFTLLYCYIFYRLTLIIFKEITQLLCKPIRLRGVHAVSCIIP